ncbi:tRNA3(Ser)-specific nuclease WapA [Pandoraea captiosa]|uniref:tRNA3(Ser)-specific nuclease WapA n=1 Tax=Pandoraea captiosa TaxID=2508302 RepID=A0A5E5A765_9BURK|nr:RHS repeat-associated core domain-containing protein [Pandoraea captiosa]VVE68333.1 tRNA3(Ser)-specific nuclease WapA [Pandoraea captiosa]
MGEPVPQPAQADRNSLYSGAQSFLSFLEKGVDPRTGTYTVRVALPVMAMNALAGPDLKLALSFDPMQNVDAGLGRGWNWGLSQLQPAARRLRLSDGETHLALLTDASITLPDQKLPSVMVEKFATRVVVTYRSGQREILEPFQPSEPLTPWVPVEIVSPQGRSVFLTWQAFEGEPSLAAMSDQERGELLRVVRTPQAVAITVAGPVPVVYEMALSDHLVTAVRLPLSGKPGWTFKYERYTNADLAFISEVTSPTGSVERMAYEEAGHRFPARSNEAPGTPPSYLPYVTRYVMEPGAGQPARVTTYTYSTENFLGYDAGVDWEDATDALYKVTSDYRYSCVESQIDESGAEPVVLATVYREFNRFHLLMEERREEDGCEYTQLNVYHDETGKPYDQQPAIVQLPRQQTVRWRRAGVSRSEMTTHRYDAWGNPIEVVMPDGVRQTTDYYDPAGEDGCPADPVWKTPRTVKAHTMLPGDATPRSPGMKPTAVAPTRMQRFRYERYPSLVSGAADFLALSEQSQLADGVTFDKVAIAYFNRPTSTLLHGRVMWRAQTLGGHTTTIDFSYAKTATDLVTTTHQHTDFDDTESATVTHTSIHTGLDTLVQSTDEVVTSRYDMLGRLVEESTTPTSEDAAYTTTLRYGYTFPSAPGGSTTQQTTRDSGIVETAYFDGTGLNVRLTRSTPDVADGETLELTRHDFDARGRKVKSTMTDRICDTTLVRTMRFAYDGWGRCHAVVRPDGVTEHDEWNAVTQVATHWLEGGGKCSGVTSRTYNRFAEIERETRTDTAGRLVSQWTYAYDGLGRRVSAVDTSRRETTYTYDFADRTSHVDLANGDTFDYAYAAHSLDAGIAQVNVNGTELGKRTFDGLMRVTDQTVGGRTTTWSFELDRKHPVQQTNAAGQVVTFALNPSLAEVPQQRVSGPVQTTYEHDPHTGQLLTATQAGGSMASATYHCERYTSGAAHIETWTDDAGEHRSVHEWTLLGLPASYEDAAGQMHRYRYDPDTGQLMEYTCGDAVLTYSWDSLGRLDGQILWQGGALRLTTTFGYDDFGREIRRETVAPGRTPLVLTQGYNDLDLLVSRTRVEGGVQRLQESMAYDRRDRLDTYYTTGTESPPDPHDPSKRISVQQWVHDAFDNIAEILTWHDGVGTPATVTYHYENDDDPTQLTAFERTGYGAANGRFTLGYDAAGRVTNDGLGNTYTYNEQDQMTSVQRSGQTPTEYGYNALDEQALVMRSGQPTRHRIFRRNKLAVEVQGTLSRSYLDGAAGTLDSSGQLLAYTVDRKSSVLEVHASGDATRGIAYSPSGYRRADVPDSVPGQDGEMVDPATQGIWLGNARLYSPVLGRFLVPDTYVPFDGGGLNAYARVDPLNSIDPTGHIPGWLGGLVTAVTSTIAVALAVFSAGIMTPVSGAIAAAGTGAGASVTAGVAAVGVTAAATTGVSAASAVTTGISIATMSANFGMLSTVAQMSFISTVSINTTIIGVSAANSIAAATGNDNLSGALSFTATVLGAIDIGAGLGFAVANARMAARAANVGTTGTRGSLTNSDSLFELADDATNTPIGPVGGRGTGGARSTLSTAPESRPPSSTSMLNKRIGSESTSLGGRSNASSSSGSRASTPTRPVVPHGTATVMAVRSAGHIAGIAARTMSELSSRPNSALSQRSSPSLSLRMRSYDREQVHAQNRQVHFDDVEDTWL